MPNDEKKQKFVVHKATIMPKGGEKKHHGDIVELDAEDARRYNNLGYLRPYVEDDYNEADYAGAQNITEGTTAMAGAVEGAVEEDKSEVTYGETDPGTHSRTSKPEIRGNPESHPKPTTGTEGRVIQNPVDKNPDENTNDRPRRSSADENENTNSNDRRDRTRRRPNTRG